METLSAVLNAVFGKTAKVRFRRIVILTVLLGAFFCLAYNLHIPGYWEPAGKVNIDLKK